MDEPECDENGVQYDDLLNPRERVRNPMEQEIFEKILYGRRLADPLPPPPPQDIDPVVAVRATAPEPRKRPAVDESRTALKKKKQQRPPPPQEISLEDMIAEIPGPPPAAATATAVSRSTTPTLPPLLLATLEDPAQPDEDDDEEEDEADKEKFELPDSAPDYLIGTLPLCNDTKPVCTTSKAGTWYQDMLKLHDEVLVSSSDLCLQFIDFVRKEWIPKHWLGHRYLFDHKLPMAVPGLDDLYKNTVPVETVVRKHLEVMPFWADSVYPAMTAADAENHRVPIMPVYSDGNNTLVQDQPFFKFRHFYCMDPDTRQYSSALMYPTLRELALVAQKPELYRKIADQWSGPSVPLLSEDGTKPLVPLDMLCPFQMRTSMSQLSTPGFIVFLTEVATLPLPSLADVLGARGKAALFRPGSKAAETEGRCLFNKKDPAEYELFMRLRLETLNCMLFSVVKKHMPEYRVFRKTELLEANILGDQYRNGQIGLAAKALNTYLIFRYLSARRYLECFCSLGEFICSPTMRHSVYHTIGTQDILGSKPFKETVNGDKPPLRKDLEGNVMLKRGIIRHMYNRVSKKDTMPGWTDGQVTAETLFGMVLLRCLFTRVFEGKNPHAYNVVELKEIPVGMEAKHVFWTQYARMSAEKNVKSQFRPADFGLSEGMINSWRFCTITQPAHFHIGVLTDFVHRMHTIYNSSDNNVKTVCYYHPAVLYSNRIWPGSAKARRLQRASTRRALKLNPFFWLHLNKLCGDDNNNEAEDKIKVNRTSDADILAGIKGCSGWAEEPARFYLAQLIKRYTVYITHDTGDWKPTNLVPPELQKTLVASKWQPMHGDYRFMTKHEAIMALMMFHHDVLSKRPDSPPLANSAALTGWALRNAASYLSANVRITKRSKCAVVPNSDLAKWLEKEFPPVAQDNSAINKEFERRVTQWKQQQ
jgi:hypothetical protein